VDGRLEPGTNMYSEGAVSEQQTYFEGAIGLNGPIEDYAKFCQMLLNRGEFNGRRILKPETVELMTTINRMPERSGAAPGFQFGLGFEIHKERKPTPAVSDSAFAWGGLMGTGYIIDPDRDLIALFYTNMFGAPPVYPRFLEHAYRLAASPEPDNRALAITLEDGGTGPFPAIVTEDPALPGFAIYRPKELAPFAGERKLPVLLWGNGACANTSNGHKNFLNEIASHGYIVLAIGPLSQVEETDERSRQPTHSQQMIEALDWVLAENGAAGSAYFKRIDPTKAAAMGMSCGGLQAIEVSSDPRIRATVVCNSGVLPSPSPLRGMPPLSKDALKLFHSPVLYIIGGPSDIAYQNAMDDFAKVDHVPFVMASHDVGHGGTYSLPRGGEFTRVALAWLNWQFTDSQADANQFLSEDSELRRDPRWTIELKNFN
jgi:dienelactone hydrolase